MVFVGPPYSLSNGGSRVHAGRRVSVDKGNWDRSKGFKDDYNFHYKWLSAVKRVLKPGGTPWVSGEHGSIILKIPLKFLESLKKQCFYSD